MKTCKTMRRICSGIFHKCKRPTGHKGAHRCETCDHVWGGKRKASRKDRRKG